MLLTLFGFISGAVIGAAHAPWWQSAPALRPSSLVSEFGPLAALALSLAVLGLIAGGTLVLERRRHGRPTPTVGNRHRGRWRILRGPWPLAAGAVGLALVNFATLVLAGRPWGITSGLTLWGSKTLAALGVDVLSWPYWSSPSRAAALHASVFTDITSVMDFGLILGALAAAGLAGRFGPVRRVPIRSAIAALAGGLMLGYGALLAYGCNIGAYFGGIASGSLHGWLWLVAAFAGGVLGTRLRPLFGLSVERSPGGEGC